MPTIEKIDPEKIRLDGGTQPRVQISQEICDDYAERMRAGDPFPKIHVYFDGKNYWLADGFHRLQASMLARPGEAVECEVYQGTREDAQWYSYGVNKAHGLRRTNEDKARAVKAALQHPKGVGKSNRQIGEHVGVHFDTVFKYRKALEREAAIGRSDIRTGRDGRTINTANIGRKPGSRKIATAHETQSRQLSGSKPCPTVFLQLSANNPQSAAATLRQLFDRSFIESLIQNLRR